MTNFTRLLHGWNHSSSTLQDHLMKAVESLQAELDSRRNEIECLKHKCIDPRAWTIEEWCWVAMLSQRAENCLRGANHAAVPGRTNGYSVADPLWHPPTDGIATVDELCQWTQGDLLRLKNLGRKSLDEIVTSLADIGLALRDPVAQRRESMGQMAVSEVQHG